ncbi:MAG: hypothetical protein CV087_04565 [Candidatus Brocadia sp. WS118]|nr:MAG: hypothetical protein CV087_04565 [Candidatus Brocadia sp. WS118]
MFTKIFAVRLFYFIEVLGYRGIYTGIIKIKPSFLSMCYDESASVSPYMNWMKFEALKRTLTVW